MSRETNKIMALDTLAKIKNINKGRRSVYISRENFHTIKKEELDLPVIEKKVTVEAEDVVESILKRSGKGKIGVLNFASARNPGGGFLNGASAQEESIARVSDLYMYLQHEKEFYSNPKHFKNGLYDNDLIYSNDVSIIKSGKGEDLSDYVDIDVITCAAVNVSDIRKKNQNDLLKLVDKEMLERIENIIEISLRNKVEILILGAFGCGVFGNSGYKVRGYFENILNKPRYKNKFKEIVFAIYEKPQDNNKLINIFKDIKV